MLNPWKVKIQQSTKILLCLAALFFPFSVAAANTALALALISGLFSSLLWHGVIKLWQAYRPLTFAIIGYLILVLLGVSWSLDKHYGLEVAGHLWLWLLLPLILMALQEKQWRSRFLISLSIGLSLHLLACVFQKLGLVNIIAGGSSTADATGYIGHISFGIVYSVWAGWLLHYGWFKHGWKRVIVWLLSLWSFAMIFSAQGRSGYMAATAVLILVFWKHLISGHDWKRMLFTLSAGALLAIIVILGPGKERIAQTIDGIQAAGQGDLRHVEARWIIWLGAIEIWKEHPVFGVGTGGYPEAAKIIKKQHPQLDDRNIYGHIHNIYLQSLVRWGPVGMIMICALFWFWLRTGSRQPWSDHSNALIELSAIALIIHGMSSVSLEEHFATIFAIFSLAVGLSSSRKAEPSSL